ncbi:MAG TPA: type 1 glutamine amidotransferase [Ktedonobacteraceae bacterium]
MKRVLALQQTWDDPPGYLEELLQEHGIICDTIEVEKMPLPDPALYQAIIVLGGPQHLYADSHLSYMVRQQELLRQAVAQDIPTLGICLGGQLLASALGAEVRRHERSEVGFYRIPLTEAGRQDPLFAGLPGHQFAFHWHGDVFELPGGAIHLASNENAPNQAFRYGPRAYGLQFHIEMNEEIASIWLRDPICVKEISETLNDPDAPARLAREWLEHAPAYQDHTRTLFENFLRIAELI